MLVNTENNYAYGLDPVSGAILWTRQFGSPPLASQIGCADLTPTMGITGTPVVDQATETEYVMDDQYVSGDSGPQIDYLHALNLADDGAEQPGFPVAIQGTASNDPSETFNATYENQRPGLLLMNGVVYVSFAAHCDIEPWQGWVVGVAAVGQSNAGQITARWSDEAGVPQTNPDKTYRGGVWM